MYLKFNRFFCKDLIPIYSLYDILSVFFFWVTIYKLFMVRFSPGYDSVGPGVPKGPVRPSRLDSTLGCLKCRNSGRGGDSKPLVSSRIKRTSSPFPPIFDTDTIKKWISLMSWNRGRSDWVGDDWEE